MSRGNAVSGLVGDKLGLRSGKVEGPEGLMKENRPASSADNPWDGNATTMGLEFVASLSADHGIDRASPIELRAAFSKSEQRRVSGHERDDPGSAVDG